MNNYLLEDHNDTLSWLANSKIRREDGGYYSEYDPGKKKFKCWGEGSSCTLSTAGAILAFLGYQRYLDQAIISGEHLLSLIIKLSHQHQGLILSGKDSKTSRCYVSSVACLSLMELFALTKEEKYLQASQKIAQALIRNMVKKDGRLRREIIIKPGLHFRFFFNLLQPTFLWDLESSLIFKKLHIYTKEQEYLEVYRRIIYWAHQNTNPEATIYFGKINLPFIFYLSTEHTLDENKANLKGWISKFHPTALTALLKTYLEANKRAEAIKLASWLRDHLGPNGLLFQWYYPDDEHSEEEDVMPTAQFGLILMENEGIFKEGFSSYLAIIYQGLLTAKIKSEDKNINASYKGLPFHWKRSDQASTWATVYALLFFREYHKRPRSVY
ncbi:hypothetical protein KKB54_01685 [bacterium]|nr:hypothetical protein [bacterium]MBU1153254.1 hypothetical protein [bacterium]MBU1782226.1 hypothetical protein [bacterium]